LGLVLEQLREVGGVVLDVQQTVAHEGRCFVLYLAVADAAAAGVAAGPDFVLAIKHCLLLAGTALNPFI
jgi:hypothetical protein